MTKVIHNCGSQTARGVGEYKTNHDGFRLCDPASDRKGQRPEIVIFLPTLCPSLARSLFWFCIRSGPYYKPSDITPPLKIRCPSPLPGFKS
jgi:hypothetical protein